MLAAKGRTTLDSGRLMPTSSLAPLRLLRHPATDQVFHGAVLRRRTGVDPARKAQTRLERQPHGLKFKASAPAFLGA